MPPYRPTSPPAPALSVRGLKLIHLRLIASLWKTGQISRAADALGLSQPAASRLFGEIQHLVSTPVYSRTRRGVELTAAGVALAKRALRSLQEIDDAGREIEAIGSVPSGEVRIGAVTGAAIEHLMPVVRTARLSLPRVTIAVEVATSDILCRLMQEGALDFALARLAPTADPAQFLSQPVSTEPVSLAVREGHPLLRRAPVPAGALTDYHWVLPFEGTILRRAVDDALRARNLPSPAQVFSTSSFLFTLALVQDTNAVAPLASSVAAAFGRPGGGVRVLDTDLAIEVETYALLTRAGGLLTPAAASVLDMVQAQIGRDCGIPAQARISSAGASLP